MAYVDDIEINIDPRDVNDGDAAGSAPTLTGADVITIDVQNASVFAGGGGRLRDDHTGLDIDDDAVGFLASNIDFRMVLARGKTGPALTAVAEPPAAELLLDAPARAPLIVEDPAEDSPRRLWPWLLAGLFVCTALAAAFYLFVDREALAAVISWWEQVT